MQQVFATVRRKQSFFYGVLLRSSIESTFQRSLSNGNGNNIQDCFQLLNLKRSFFISNEDLKASYKNLMKELHPDKHTLKPQNEQKLITDQASAVTKAYDVLQKDYDRALHLLELEGEPMEDTTSGDLVGLGVLMEVMEYREEVDATTSSTSSKEEKELKLTNLKLENEKRKKKAIKEIGLAFDSHNLDEVKRWTAMLQYWNRIEETIQERI